MIMAKIPEKKICSFSKREKTPSVLQMEAVECGAASLSMILAYYGRFEPLEKLRSECGVSRDGSKAGNLLKAARKFGLEAHGYKKAASSLQADQLPMVIFWNFNHFLVLEGGKKNKIYLNDPASGPRIVENTEFDNSYTGVALTFKPGPDFKPGGTKPSVLKPLTKRLKGSENALIYIILAALFLVIPGIVIPSFFKIFIDDVLSQGMTGWFRPLLLGMAVAAILTGILNWLKERYLLRMQTKLAITGASRFLGHVFRLPVNFFFQRFAGDIASRVELNDNIAMLLSQQIATNFINLLLLFFYAAIMFQYDILLTTVGIGIAVLNMAALQFVSRKRKTLNEKLQMEKGKLTGQAMTGLQLMETMKASGAETDFFEQWSGYQARTINSQQQLSVTNQFLGAIPPFLMSVNTAAILGVGGIRVMDGDLSIGMLVAFQSLMMGFMGPINQLVALGSTIQETWADINRIEDVLYNEQDHIFQSNKRLEPIHDSDKVKIEGALELQDISFGYSLLEPPLIEGFSMKLSPGQRVAIVGASGSGKSTIAKVLSGLYLPWKGKILFDNKDAGELARDLLTNSVAMVDQDIFLFEGSVIENISMWNSAIPEERIVQAGTAAMIHEDIAARPEGYKSNVAENGSNFSGGQRQRIEIARALATEPTLLIMDEATSALDTVTEKKIDENIRRIGCSCIIIAHRLSTIRDADHIIVLNKGKIVEQGTHDELLKIQGEYAELTKNY